ncbi:MAG: replication-associated recombination protein A [Dysgonamonadaceae bacterium]|jgi:putative ATPase|nr:replication-associated recombination protein A [Dysgonamonadaceae bacterium]
MQISSQPLADRMRPTSLDEYTGQKHLVGEHAVLRRMIESGNISSFILWGSPGVGKTTLAQIIASSLKRPFYSLSAVNSGVKDVRETIENAKKQKFFSAPCPVLFIDEIHRFSKSQQDSLLAAVEQGVVVLIGATTENPSFEVISPLLSRCQVYTLKSLDKADLLEIIDHALKKDSLLKTLTVRIEETDALLRVSGGDARKLLNALELVIVAELDADGKAASEIVITDAKVLERVQQNIALYDKNGEMHYDIISAFIKSIRGSDPNAAVYYLARMIEGGEDPLFIARRLIILASEDIGLANPNAFLMAQSCFNAVHSIGMPEGRIVLSQTTIYLAVSPKSNSSYEAIDHAIALVRQTGNLPVPLHIRNAPTKLMKELGYHKGYQYAHSFTGNFVDQEFLPPEISGSTFYKPGSNAREKEIKERLDKLWNGKYK